VGRGALKYGLGGVLPYRADHQCPATRPDWGVPPLFGTRCLLHAAASTSPAAVTAPVVQRVGRIGVLASLGARSQCQHNEERGEPSLPVHRFILATRSAAPNPRPRLAR
jgi:hypothetical protein